MATPAQTNRILILFFRRDLRLQDNPLLHALTRPQPRFAHTHVLPVYIFDPEHVELAGFLPDPDTKFYEPCRTKIGNFWRTGPFRAKFIAESAWDFKQSLKKKGSDLMLYAGRPHQILSALVDYYRARGDQIAGVWMAALTGTEEKETENELRHMFEDYDVPFQLHEEGGYIYSQRELSFEYSDLPDVFTQFKMRVEPLRATIPIPYPAPHEIPPLPSICPLQPGPFIMPENLPDLIRYLTRSLHDLLPGGPMEKPTGAETSHPFTGGETRAKSRLHHLLVSGALSSYKETRNSLMGADPSTKLSAYLAQGCISPRFIHQVMLYYEDGKAHWADQLVSDPVRNPEGDFGKGENDGTYGFRYQLLWRDYYRLAAIKYDRDVFSIDGYRRDSPKKWQNPRQSKEAAEKLARFLRGNTGTSLIDASMRELYHTGYTSNRARQNVASYFAKRLGVDWRIGAEWYESMLVDYDVNSNWGNWQYNVGVGNDPRGISRNFNQVRQARVFDPEGEYIRRWVAELRLIPDRLVPQTPALRDEERDAVAAFSEDARKAVEEPLVVIGDHELNGPYRPVPKYDPDSEAESESGSGSESESAADSSKKSGSTSSSCRRRAQPILKLRRWHVELSKTAEEITELEEMLRATFRITSDLDKTPRLGELDAATKEVLIKNLFNPYKR